MTFWIYFGIISIFAIGIGNSIMNENRASKRENDRMLRRL